MCVEGAGAAMGETGWELAEARLQKPEGRVSLHCYYRTSPSLGLAIRPTISSHLPPGLACIMQGRHLEAQ